MNIKKKSQKIRRIFMFTLMKKIIPSTFKELELLSSIKLKSRINRPSINIMSSFFNGKKVSGIELGVRCGTNSKNILKKLNVKKLTLIDVWKSYEGQDNQYSNEKNYNRVKLRFSKDKRVEIIKGFSKDIIKYFKDNSLDFIYIDANHSFKYVYSDIIACFPKIKKGGFLAGHDVFNKIDVLYAVRKFCLDNDIPFKIKLPDWYIFKEKD